MDESKGDFIPSFGVNSSYYKPIFSLRKWADIF